MELPPGLRDLFFYITVVCQLTSTTTSPLAVTAQTAHVAHFIFRRFVELALIQCLNIMIQHLGSSRGAKLSSTPSSLRKELRHLSRELSASDVAISSSFSSRKAKPSLKNAEKENSRPPNHALRDEWVRGGGNASPAVFSFSGASLSPLSDAKITSKGVQFPAYSNSVSCADTAENSAVCRSAISVQGAWEGRREAVAGGAAGAGIPRGLMVRGVLFSVHIQIPPERIPAAYQLPRDVRCAFPSCWDALFLACFGIAICKVIMPRRLDVAWCFRHISLQRPSTTRSKNAGMGFSQADSPSFLQLEAAETLSPPPPTNFGFCQRAHQALHHARLEAVSSTRMRLSHHC